MGMLLRRHYMTNVDKKGASLDSGVSSKKDIKSDTKTSRRSNRTKSVEKKEG